MQSTAPQSLFDVFDRTDFGRASRLEHEYLWLNRSARPEVEVARQELESWAALFPRDDLRPLIQRFRSTTKDDAHSSALFELFVHEHLRRVGFQVACHPSVSGTNKTPDFAVRGRDGGTFYVEAVLAGPSVKERRATHLQNVALEVVDSFDSTAFWVTVRIRGQATQYLPTRKLRTEIRRWLQELTSDGPEGSTSSRARLFVWEEHGLRLELKAYPKDAATTTRRLLASETYPARRMPPCCAAVAGALRKKAPRYGVPDKPYLVAINVLAPGVSESEIRLALREVWGTETHPKFQRVSGVLLTTVWNPFSAHHAKLVAVLNPAARHPLLAEDLPFPPLSGSIPW